MSLSLFYNSAHALAQVSHVKFQPGAGDCLLTSSYDKTCKLWSGFNFNLFKTLAGHEARVMRADISPDSSTVSACVC